MDTPKPTVFPADKPEEEESLASQSPADARLRPADGSDITEGTDVLTAGTAAFVMGGAMTVLSAGAVSSKRERRFYRRRQEHEREKHHIFDDLHLGPDLGAKGFSARNAFFFSHLSSTMYLARDEVEAHYRTLGITEFFWFTPPDRVARSPFSQINDTQAAVAATTDYIAVVFRGTQEGADWWTNLKFLHRHFPRLGRVHEGFSEGLDTVWHGEGMFDKLREMHEESPRPIYVTGHSLGAALATIAAARIAVNHDLPLAALYTVGSPRVFDRRGALAFDSWENHGTALSEKSFRGVNNNDIVTAVPPEVVDYAHVGTKIYINSRGSIDAGQFWDGLLGTWEAFTRGSFLDFVDDHDVGKYAAAFRRAASKARMGGFKRVVMAATYKAAHESVETVADALGGEAAESSSARSSSTHESPSSDKQPSV